MKPQLPPHFFARMFPQLLQEARAAAPRCAVGPSPPTPPLQAQAPGLAEGGKGRGAGGRATDAVVAMSAELHLTWLVTAVAEMLRANNSSRYKPVR